MKPQEIAAALVPHCIHIAWVDVGRPFFIQGFVRGFYMAQQAARPWLPVVFGAGFVVGFVLGGLA